MHEIKSNSLTSCHLLRELHIDVATAIKLATTLRSVLNMVIISFIYSFYLSLFPRSSRAHHHLMHCMNLLLL